MKNVLIAAALVFVVSTPASANWFQDLLYGRSLDARVEEPNGLGIANGKSQTGYLFDTDLVIGTALPIINDGPALLAAARVDQTIEIAGPWSFEYPVLQEIARQNRVSTQWLINHLNDNWAHEDSSPELAIEQIVEEATEEAEHRMEMQEQVQEQLEEQTQERNDLDGFAGDTTQEEIDNFKQKITEEQFKALQDRLCEIRGC